MPDNPTSSPLPSPQPRPQVNSTAQDVVTEVEKLETEGEQAAETAIIAAVPWMGTVVLKQIWEGVFDWLFWLIAKPLASLSGRVVITAEEYLALRNVASAQVALATAKQKGDTHAIQEASAQVDLAVAPVIQYIGATHS